MGAAVLFVATLVVVVGGSLALTVRRFATLASGMGNITTCYWRIGDGATRRVGQNEAHPRLRCASVQQCHSISLAWVAGGSSHLTTRTPLTSIGPATRMCGMWTNMSGLMPRAFIPRRYSIWAAVGSDRA